MTLYSLAEHKFTMIYQMSFIQLCDISPTSREQYGKPSARYGTQHAHAAIQEYVEQGGTKTL